MRHHAGDLVGGRRGMGGDVLVISNGHGEDNDSGHVIRALRELAPDITCAAVPIVGLGAEYQKLGVPILTRVRTMPSGGFVWQNRMNLLRDLVSGLPALTLHQWRVVRAEAPAYRVVLATGDWVAQTFGRASGRPFVSFITSLSAMYTGTLPVGPLLRRALNSPRRRFIATRDRPTAEDLTRRGFRDVQFGGLPSLDWIRPSGRDLALPEGARMAALLPGSRLPEAVRNFKVMLRFARLAAVRHGDRVRFRAALVPQLMEELPAIAEVTGWALEGERMRAPGAEVDLMCHADAFNDILCRADIVIGMAGLAVDQAVALGKPVLQIEGEGPQFNRRFTRRQEMLLGLSVRTIGRAPVTDTMLAAGADRMVATLDDVAYLAACRENGRARLGTPGGAHRVAQLLLQELGRA